MDRSKSSILMALSSENRRQGCMLFGGSKGLGKGGHGNPLGSSIGQQLHLQGACLPWSKNGHDATLRRPAERSSLTEAGRVRDP